MVNIIKPKVNIIDYGPKLVLGNGQVIIPDEFVWGASRIAYKDIGTIHELLELKKDDKDISETIKKSLINSAGAGHASMATTPGFWVFLEGESSKMVDSMFTGARFASSLMPSGRRVPVEVDKIVVPKGIHEHSNKELENLYLATSEKNIHAYELLQERGVPKQEASKIVQYGHRGGGFMFLPLETIIHFAKDAEDNQLMPREGKEILSQLEDFIHSHGCGITYEARKAAPRTGCVNPNIFHNRKNLAQELIDNNYKNCQFEPVTVSHSFIESEERDERVHNWLLKRKEIFANPESIKDNWAGLLRELEHIVEDYNNSFSVTTISNSPWRVWGEVKRHRTLPQTTESVYNAVDRAREVVANNHGEFYEKGLLGEIKFAYSPVLSIPASISNDQENFNLWINRFRESVKVYDKLVNAGIEKRDAIHIIPRGLKMGILKQFDFYNSTTGYLSLRQCFTAEPEMRAISEKESKLISQCIRVPYDINLLLTPKCHYVGFCSNAKPCGQIKKAVPGYDIDINSNVRETLKQEIRDKL